MTQPTLPLIIYHDNCADGFGAAWTVRQALGGENVDFHAGHYGKPAPDVEGRDVIIVDFSYPYELLALLGHRAWWLPAWLDRLLPILLLTHRHRLQTSRYLGKNECPTMLRLS